VKSRGTPEGIAGQRAGPRERGSRYKTRAKNKWVKISTAAKRE
jgi:hypothetical protein